MTNHRSIIRARLHSVELLRLRVACLTPPDHLKRPILILGNLVWSTEIASLGSFEDQICAVSIIIERRRVSSISESLLLLLVEAVLSRSSSFRNKVSKTFRIAALSGKLVTLLELFFDLFHRSNTSFGSILLGSRLIDRAFITRINSFSFSRTDLNSLNMIWKLAFRVLERLFLLFAF